MQSLVSSPSGAMLGKHGRKRGSEQRNEADPTRRALTRGVDRTKVEIRAQDKSVVSSEVAAELRDMNKVGFRVRVFGHCCLLELSQHPINH